MHKPTFAALLIILMFAGWWAGVDYFERDFMPAFWFVSSLSFSVMISVLVNEIRDGKL